MHCTRIKNIATIKFNRPVFFFWSGFWSFFYAKRVGFWGSAPGPDGGAYSAPTHHLAGYGSINWTCKYSGIQSDLILPCHPGKDQNISGDIVMDGPREGSKH